MTFSYVTPALCLGHSSSMCVCARRTCTMQLLPSDVFQHICDFLHGADELQHLLLVSLGMHTATSADSIWSHARAKREGVLHKAIAFGMVVEMPNGNTSPPAFDLDLYRRVVAKRGHVMDYQSLWLAVRKWAVNPQVTKREYGPIEYWDTSAVRSLDFLFTHTNGFDEDLSRWDVSNVRDMRGLFYASVNFAANVSTWNVSNVYDMGYSFFDAVNFKADVSGWDVSNVVHKRLSGMHLLEPFQRAML